MVIPTHHIITAVWPVAHPLNLLRGWELTRVQMHTSRPYTRRKMDCHPSSRGTFPELVRSYQLSTASRLHGRTRIPMGTQHHINPSAGMMDTAMVDALVGMSHVSYDPYRRTFLPLMASSSTWAVRRNTRTQN